ncbi:hypothetical protein [Natrinema salaciae]|uniref:Uncharacterized protein n=1 Tax=Natrinema salaciae TaxID=1186196 RepID=A0A1H9EYM0_9EURY|nr:hypothetical protein [Natrinema salaciae]SEQ30830.1 hypothetical protein SAMN04489841_1420 [Natrinema salaciae]
MAPCTLLFVLSATFVFAAFIALLAISEGSKRPARVAETPDEDPQGGSALEEFGPHETRWGR